MKYMVLKYPDGNYVAVDRDSGYPYPTHSLDIAKIWTEPFFPVMKSWINCFPMHKFRAVELCDADSLAKAFGV